MKQYVPYAIASLLGAMLTFSFAPFSMWWVSPICLSLLFFTFYRFVSQPFYFGLWFGLGWFGAGVSWVHVSISDFGGLPLIGSLGLMVLLCGYLALFPAAFFALLKRFVPSNSLIVGAIPLWWTMEWVRSWFLSGFPWLSLGYSQVSGPFSGFVPIIGETGVSVLLVALALYVGQSLSVPKSSDQHLKNNPIMQVVSIVTVIFILGYGLTYANWVSPNEDTPSITMVQGNIKQELRWVPEQDKPTMDAYLELTEPHWDSDFIIWPEAAIPKLEPLAQDFLYELDQRAIEEKTALVTGIVNYNFEMHQAFNNLIVVGNQPEAPSDSRYQYMHQNRYAKHHLLPIGEFIPMEDWLRGLAPIFDLPMSSFSRGDYRQANLSVNGWNLAPAICFEIAFPRQIRDNLHSDTDFIITVSNDAWFGRSHGPAQHLEIAQMRALEMGIPVIRSTNNGITAFINHRGEIVAKAPQFERTTLRHDLATTSGITPYRYWGDAIGWLFALVLAGVTLWRVRTTTI